MNTTSDDKQFVALNRHYFTRHFLAFLDSAFHSLLATINYWNHVCVCCYKKFQYNRIFRFAHLPL